MFGNRSMINNAENQSRWKNRNQFLMFLEYDLISVYVEAIGAETIYHFFTEAGEKIIKYFYQMQAAASCVESL